MIPAPDMQKSDLWRGSRAVLVRDAPGAVNIHFPSGPKLQTPQGF
jgi:hypothetical protein